VQEGLDHLRAERCRMSVYVDARPQPGSPT